MTILDSMKAALADMDKGILDTYLSLLSDDYQLYVNGQPTPVNRQIIEVLLRALRKAAPDLTLGVTNVRQEGDDKVTFDTLMTGTHTGVMELPGVPPGLPSNERIQGDPQTAIFTFVDGKIVHEDIQLSPGSDPMSLYKQLGIEQLPG